MKKSRAELKLMAKQNLMGNYGTAVGSMLILGSTLIGLLFILYFVVLGAMVGATLGMARFDRGFSAGMGAGAVIIMFVFMLAIYLLEYMVLPGLIRIYYNLCTGKPAKMGDLLFAFKNNFKKFFGLSAIMVLLMFFMMIIQMAVSFVGSDVLMFLYIVIFSAISIGFSLNFGLFFTIIVEDPNVKVIEALKISMNYMKGNKWRYFVLYLSFFGWLILSYMTCYIALLWLVPYMGCTFLHFYLDVKAEHEKTVSGTGTSDFQAEFNDISSKENVDA